MWLLVCLVGAAFAKPPIDTVVVLMLENRAFDHMCGFLKAENPMVDGLTGREFNLVNSSDPNSRSCPVDDRAPFHTRPDPDHSVDGTRRQMFGSRGTTGIPSMSGFVEAYHGSCSIMSAFSTNNVPVISTLSHEFAIFDKWYASVPGPTFPNRLYANSGTSYGFGTNDIPQTIAGWPQKPIWQALEEHNVTWKTYFEMIPDSLLFTFNRDPKHWDKLALLDTFVADARNGTLPQYSVVQPSWFDLPFWPASDQHPDHDVERGEALIKRVYEAVRAGPKWNSTLLIVTYDEHGGFFDHSPPPTQGIPNPDGRNTPTFNFDRLGIRVPTLMISPWINKRTVVHEGVGPTPTSHYDHTSVLATVKKLYGLPSFLTRRDEWASTFEHVWADRTSPRTDCPLTLPTPPAPRHGRRLSDYGEQAISDLGYEFIELAAALTGSAENGRAFRNQEEGGRFVRRQMNEFLGRQLFTEFI